MSKDVFVYVECKDNAVRKASFELLSKGKEIADVAIQIINGKSPSEIPFSRIQQIKTVINIGAAKAYGLETPKELLKSADQIIKE